MSFAKTKLENAIKGLDGVSSITSLEELVNQDLVDTSNCQSLPLRAYLDKSLVPALVEGLRLVSQERLSLFNNKCRPSNPLEYLGMFLLSKKL
jgi:hypothetical protein